MTSSRAALIITLLLIAAGCSKPIPGPGPSTPGPSVASAAPNLGTSSPPEPEPDPTPPPKAWTSPCPEGMILIDHLYCPRLKWRCLKRARVNGVLRKNTCQRYHPEPICLSDSLRRQRFCIDTFEYPNRAGAYPPVMVSAFDAAALCQEQGKRLCWESEWTAACEGKPAKPYPYGISRDASRCNMDKPGRDIDPDALRSEDATIRDATLSRLNQSVPSGSMSGCRSDYGVFDLTGNLSEWVFIEKPGGQCTWAGVKGGHWTNARNACRPTGKAHPEGWTFYPLSFRCCKTPAPDTTTHNDLMEWTPPATPAPATTGAPTNRGWTPPRR